MLQTKTILSPEMTVEERLSTIREAFDGDRTQMTLMLARKLNVQEIEVVRALQGDLSHELDFARWEELVRSFESLGNVHVIVSNGAVTLEGFGQFANFSNTDGFFNVRSKSLDMHIRSWELASVFAFRKPSHTDGREALSFQFFDRRGDAAFKVFLTFGGHDPSPELMKIYHELIEKFSKG